MGELHKSCGDAAGNTTEMGRVDSEKHFTRLVAAEVAGNLQVNYGDRDVVVKLLTSSLERLLCTREGLLEQYLHTQLDIIAQSIKFDFDVPNDVNVNYEYATHAKLKDILDYIKNNNEITD